MASNPNQHLIEYLSEQRRHYLALAKAAERAIVALQEKSCYNTGEAITHTPGDVVSSSFTEFVKPQQ